MKLRKKIWLNTALVFASILPVTLATSTLVSCSSGSQTEQDVIYSPNNSLIPFIKESSLSIIRDYQMWKAKSSPEFKNNNISDKDFKITVSLNDFVLSIVYRGTLSQNNKAKPFVYTWTFNLKGKNTGMPTPQDDLFNPNKSYSCDAKYQIDNKGELTDQKNSKRFVNAEELTIFMQKEIYPLNALAGADNNDPIYKPETCASGVVDKFGLTQDRLNKILNNWSTANKALLDRNNNPTNASTYAHYSSYYLKDNLLILRFKALQVEIPEIRHGSQLIEYRHTADMLYVQMFNLSNYSYVSNSSFSYNVKKFMDDAHPNVGTYARSEDYGLTIIPGDEKEIKKLLAAIENPPRNNN